MRIEKDVLVTKIIGSHEKRIGTLELVLQGLLMAFLMKATLKIILDKLYNRLQDI